MVLTQREIPEFVNEAVITAAKKLNLTVVQDVGGEDRPIDNGLLKMIDYLCPNESELERLTGMPTSNEEEVCERMQQLLGKHLIAHRVTIGR